jgi:hypothetical protein
MHINKKSRFFKTINSEKICAVATCPCKLATQDKRLEEQATNIENWVQGKYTEILAGKKA